MKKLVVLLSLMALLVVPSFAQEMGACNVDPPAEARRCDHDRLDLPHHGFLWRRTVGLVTVWTISI